MRFNTEQSLADKQTGRPCSSGLTPVTLSGYCLYPGTKISLFTPMPSHLLSPPAQITIPLVYTFFPVLSDLL